MHSLCREKKSTLVRKSFLVCSLSSLCLSLSFFPVPVNPFFFLLSILWLGEVEKSSTLVEYRFWCVGWTAFLLSPSLFFGWWSSVCLFSSLSLLPVPIQYISFSFHGAFFPWVDVVEKVSFSLLPLSFLSSLPCTKHRPSPGCRFFVPRLGERVVEKVVFGVLCWAGRGRMDFFFLFLLPPSLYTEDFS